MITFSKQRNKVICAQDLALCGSILKSKKLRPTVPDANFSRRHCDQGLPRLRRTCSALMNAESRSANVAIQALQPLSKTRQTFSPFEIPHVICGDLKEVWPQPVTKHYLKCEGCFGHSSLSITRPINVHTCSLRRI